MNVKKLHVTTKVKEVVRKVAY